MKCRCRKPRVRRCGTFRNANGVVQRYACTRCGKSWSGEQPIPGVRIALPITLGLAGMLLGGSSLRGAAERMGISHKTAKRIALKLNIKTAPPPNAAWLKNERKVSRKASLASLVEKCESAVSQPMKRDESARATAQPPTWPQGVFVRRHGQASRHHLGEMV